MREREREDEKKSGRVGGNPFISSNTPFVRVSTVVLNEFPLALTTAAVAAC